MQREDSEVTEEMMRLVRGNEPIEGEKEIIERIYATQKAKNKTENEKASSTCIIN